MKLLVEWIRKRPLAAFFIICYSISWGLWLPIILSRSDISELLALVGVFGGPSLACIIVAGTSLQRSGSNHPTPFWKPFLGAWVVCTLVFSTYNLVTTPSAHPVVHVIFAGLAVIPAFVIASAFSGAAGVRRTLSSLTQPRGWWGWYLLALLIPLAIRLISVWVSNQLGWEFMSNPQLPTNLMNLTISVLVIFLYTLVYAGGLNEETGWTGFAFPRLLAKYNPLISTILIWILWILWHVPMHFAGYFNLSMHVLIGSFLGRFLVTWLFIRSSGGLLTAILLHTSVNVTSQFVPLTNASLLIDGLVAFLVVAEGKMWQRLPHSSPAVFTDEPSARLIMSF